MIASINFSPRSYRRSWSRGIGAIVVMGVCAFFSSARAQTIQVVGDKVGIGTPSPGSKLQLEKTANDTVSLNNSFFFFADTPLGAGLLGQQKLTAPYAFVLQAQNQTNNAFFPVSLNPNGGNVGVGTANPGVKLVVSGDGSNAEQFRVERGGGNTAHLAFTSYSIQRLNFDGNSGNIVLNENGGNVGIGTGTPSSKLEVAGDILAKFNSGPNEPVFKHVDISGNFVFSLNRSDGAGGNGNDFVLKSLNKLYFSTNNTDAAKMVIDNGGNIGIGTTVPNRKLDVNGYIYGGGVTSNTINSTGGDSHWFKVTSGGSKDSHALGITDDVVTHTTVAGMYIKGPGQIGFSGVQEGITAADIFINETGGKTLLNGDGGNVGIGTTNPVDTLNINGNLSLEAGNAIRIYANAAHNSWASILLDGSERFILTRDLISSGNLAIFGSPNPNGTLTLDSTASQTKGSILVAPSGGNVGIGTTAPGSKLEANGTIRVTGSTTPTTNGGGLELSYNGNVGIVEAYNRGVGGTPLYIFGYPTALLGGNVGIGTSNPTQKLQFTPNSFIGLPGGSGTYVPTAWQRGTSGMILAGSSNPDGSGWAHGSRIVSVDYGDGMNFEVDTVNASAWSNSALVVSSRNGRQGNVGIGTSSPDYKLTVAGPVRATQFIGNVNTWSDSVFKPGYRLSPLSEIEAAIQVNGHLPEIPSEAEVKRDGIDMAQMQAKLLQKVEELTLHMIAHEKELQALRSENESLRRKVTDLQNR